MIEIRVAQRVDMKAVHGLITELAIYEKEPDAVTISVQDLERDGFDLNKFECFLAEHVATSEIVGMALYYPRYSTWKGSTLHLEDLYIQPLFRGRGLGRKLFDEVVKIAVKDNVGRMEWTVLEWNKPAIEFYKTYNATLDPEWYLGTFSNEQLQKFK